MKMLLCSESGCTRRFHDDTMMRNHLTGEHGQANDDAEVAVMFADTVEIVPEPMQHPMECALPKPHPSWPTCLNKMSKPVGRPCPERGLPAHDCSAHDSIIARYG